VELLVGVLPGFQGIGDSRKPPVVAVRPNRRVAEQSSGR